MKTTVIGSVNNKPIIITDRTIEKIKFYGKTYICRKMRELADKIEANANKNK